MTDRWDYEARCADIELAMAVTRERIDEWDETTDPHGWWHERPRLIALINRIEQQDAELAELRSLKEAAKALEEPIHHMDCAYCHMTWPSAARWVERAHEADCPWLALQKALGDG